MSNVRLSRLNCINWLAEGPLAPHINTFKQYLTDRGYAATTFTNCVGSIAHFAQWVHGRLLRVQRIDEAAVDEFLDEHLPRCRCTGPRYRAPDSLMRFLQNACNYAKNAPAPDE